MRLPDISATVSSITARLVRDAVVYGLCALCGVVILILAVQAAVLALEPPVGVVYARLLVAGAFALIAAGALLWLKFTRPRARAAATKPAAVHANGLERGEVSERSLQIAQIIEAVMLGYQMSSRRSERRHSKTH
jgi:hypothetical protein